MNAKRELIVICNNCYPVPSATGLLALNCINYLHEEFNVRVIAVQDRNHCYYKNNMGTYELYTVKNHRLGIYYTTNS